MVRASATSAAPSPSTSVVKLVAAVSTEAIVVVVPAIAVSSSAMVVSSSVSRAFTSPAVSP